MIKFVVFVVAYIAIVSAMPALVEDEEGQQYYLTPVSGLRIRRYAQWYGGGGGNSHSQGGFIGKQNPNGSGFSAGYGHANGYGHTASVDAMVPVWSSKGGATTVNVGGGATQHFGGPAGDRNLDKRVGVSVTHNF